MIALIAVLLFVLGFVLGVWGTTASLRQKAEVLDAERLELERDRADLREAQRRHFDEVVQFVAMRESKNKPAPSRWMA